jgi:hypothetical protein
VEKVEVINNKKMSVARTSIKKINVKSEFAENKKITQ